MNFSAHVVRRFAAAPAALLILLTGVLPASAEIIPADRTAPWQGNVGVPGGIPNRTTVYKNIVTDLGADPTGVADAADIIRNALATCPANQVVYVPAGTYRINSGISTNYNTNNYTLRGAGMGRTILKLYNNSQFAYGSGDYPSPTGTVPVASGATRGSNSVVLTGDLTYVVPGHPLAIQLAANPTYMHSLGGAPDSRLSQVAIVNPLTKVGSTVTFDPPLPKDWTAGATSIPYSIPFVHGIGYEDLTLDLSGSTAFCASRAEQAYGCWLKNIEVTGAYSRQIYWTCVS